MTDGELGSCVELTGLTERQRELILWQLVTDLGGEISVIPADDVPKRRLIFYQGDEGYVDLCATEDWADQEGETSA